MCKTIIFTNASKNTVVYSIMHKMLSYIVSSTKKPAIAITGESNTRVSVPRVERNSSFFIHRE